MTRYQQWREDNIKSVGLPLQLKSEAVLDKRETMNKQELWDERTGESLSVKEDVASVYRNRKTHTVKKLTFMVPSFPWKDQ